MSVTIFCIFLSLNSMKRAKLTTDSSRTLYGRSNQSKIQFVFIWATTRNLISGFETHTQYNSRIQSLLVSWCLSLQVFVGFVTINTCCEKTVTDSDFNSITNTASVATAGYTGYTGAALLGTTVQSTVIQYTMNSTFVNLATTFFGSN